MDTFQRNGMREKIENKTKHLHGKRWRKQVSKSEKRETNLMFGCRVGGFVHHGCTHNSIQGEWDVLSDGRKMKCMNWTYQIYKNNALYWTNFPGNLCVV